MSDVVVKDVRFVQKNFIWVEVANASDSEHAVIEIECTRFVSKERNGSWWLRVSDVRGRLGFAAPRDDMLGAEADDDAEVIFRVAGDLGRQYVRKHLANADES
jgi:hypothetical protein